MRIILAVLPSTRDMEEADVLLADIYVGYTGIGLPHID